MNADSNNSLCQNSTLARDNGVERIVVALYADEIDRTFDVTRTTIVQVDGPACELSESDRKYLWSIYQDIVEADDYVYYMHN